MGIRQTLNENPVVTTAVTGLILLAAAIFVFRMACAGPGPSRWGAPPVKYYFTVDDGQTYFADDAKKIPPFDHQGKPAYRVQIFRCPDGSRHVSHLERYTPADKKKVEEVLAKAGDRHIGQLEQTIFLGLKEVKKPGAKEWVKGSVKTQEEYAAIQRPKCPDGSTKGILWVIPE